MACRTFILTLILLLICSPLNSYAQDYQSITVENAQDLEMVGILENGVTYYGRYHHLIWSPDGKTWAAVSAVGVVIYNAADPTQSTRLIANGVWDTKAAAYSPDSTQIVTFGSDGAVRLWDITSGELQQTFTGHSGEVTCIAFSSDGTILVSGENDGTVHVWNIAAGEPQLVIEGHDRVTHVAISPDNTMIASAGSNYVVRLWDAVTGEARSGHGIHSNLVTGLAFSPDSKMLASGSGDNTVVLWDVTLPGVVQVLPCPLEGVSFGEQFAVIDITYNSQGDLALVRLDGSISVWHQPSSVASGDPVVTDLPGSRRWQTSGFLAFSPDGKKLLRGSSDARTEVWDIETSDLIQSIPGHDFDPSYMAYTVAENRAAFAEEHAVKVWDLTTGTLEQTFSIEYQYIRGLDFSPDGQWLAETESYAYGQGGIVHLWDIASGELLWDANLGRGAGGITFSFDGSLLATSSADISAEGPVLFNFATGNRLRVLEQPLITTQEDKSWVTNPATGETQYITDLYLSWDNYVFGRDDTLVAAADNYPNKLIAIWDVESGNLVQLFASASDDLAASASGTVLAVLTKEDGIGLWDMASGQAINQLSICPNSSGVDIAVNPDGTLVAAACEDGTIELWDVAIGENRAILDTQSQYNLYRTSVWFNADSTLLFSFCSDGALRRWGIPTN